MPSKLSLSAQNRSCLSTIMKIYLHFFLLLFLLHYGPLNLFLASLRTSAHSVWSNAFVLHVYIPIFISSNSIFFVQQILYLLCRLSVHFCIYMLEDVNQIFIPCVCCTALLVEGGLISVIYKYLNSLTFAKDLRDSLSTLCHDFVLYSTDETLSFLSIYFQTISTLTAYKVSVFCFIILMFMFNKLSTQNNINLSNIKKYIFPVEF